ncbi:type II toxin-antitoxin system RelE/ParE family toxin [Shewanella xiamenensis]|uniref:type II toxin-antitoxin system RelE/ParE family toxin n=1 Tax=Shewanella xiamenensis TaxID=332186 RepID=UPI001CC6AE0F|nr:type II toxin-antitoxin system RelE/ParE family toxin [Shewanella xiamenensis]BDA63144.1 plasmid stabilization protein [Shewanella xiamenensis]
MQVRWLRKAAQNLEDAYDYLAKDNPKVAQAFVLDVYRLVNLLTTQPAMGRAGRVAGTRELVVQDYPFIIPYRVHQDEIHILRVFHTKLRLPSHW